MLKDVNDDRDRQNYLRVMAYTPLPGALALKASDYENLKELMLKNELLSPDYLPYRM